MWAAVGPYYAVFPIGFADSVIAAHTQPGDVVLDPFAGRGTTVFAAAKAGRTGIGIEICPVGWVYCKVKLDPAPMEAVLARSSEVATYPVSPLRLAELPEFFRHAYSPGVLRYLLAARDHLDWRRRKIDRTLMAFLLVYLHGKRGAAFSNQMRQTKAMSPHYSVRWWQERGLAPPELDPIDFLRTRIEWRYKHGTLFRNDSQVFLGDSMRMLTTLASRQVERCDRRAQLLLTSPPYYKVANYHYDQWIRMWLLGGPPTASRTGERYKGKFDSAKRYRSLLKGVFHRCRRLVRPDATIYVRTDHREFTRTSTEQALREAFPEWKIGREERPYSGATQSELFSHPRGKGDIDMILTPK